MAKPHPEFLAGVRWAAAFLRDLATQAILAEPCDQGRPLCLTDAAAKLLAAQRRPRRRSAGTAAPPQANLL